MKRGLLILCLFSLLFIVNSVEGAFCGGNVTCNCGDNVTVDTVLTYDLLDCNNDGLFLNSNVVLDCQGHKISRNLSQGGFNGSGGVSTGGPWPRLMNNTVKNCVIEYFDKGIYSYGSEYNQILNNILRNNSYGIYGSLASNGTIKGNEIYNNYRGIHFGYSSDNNISGNIIRDNKEGIIFHYNGGENNIIWANNFSNNKNESGVSLNAYSYRHNIWNFGKMGNYWDDFDHNNSGYPIYYNIERESYTNRDYWPVGSSGWPHFNSTPNLTAIEGELYNYEIITSLVPEDYGTLTLSLLNPPKGMIIAENGPTRWINWTPNYFQAGENEISILAEYSDNESAFNYSNTQNFTITVLNTPVADLSISESDIYLSDNNPTQGELIWFTALIHDVGEITPESIKVYFYVYDGEDMISNGYQIIDTTKKTKYENLPKVVEEEIAKENVYAVQSAWNTIPGDYEIYIEIDSNNEIIEMNETNNIAFKPFQVRTVPDLIVEPNDMFFSNPSPDEGEEITIFSMIHNSESVNTTNFYVQIYYDDPSNMIAEEIIYIEENGTQVILSPWTAMAGEHNIYIDVDPYEEVEELDETNNFASRIINVISTGSLPPVMSNLPEMYIDIDNPIFQFDLDEYVTDPDNTINQLTWSYYGNYNISIDIDINHIATISPISGEDILETITFRVEDPNGNFDEKSTFVNVSNFTDGDGDNFFMEVNDCDDTKLLVNPFMEENCRTVYDDNCDGRINEGCKKIVYPYFRMD